MFPMTLAVFFLCPLRSISVGLLISLDYWWVLRGLKEVIKIVKMPWIESQYKRN